jgi:hypothetical protein
MTQSKVDKIAEMYPDALLVDGMDEAIIGVEEKDGRVVYDSEIIIKVLSRDMSEEEAIDYYGYNIVGAYVGEKTPIYITRL